MGTIKKVTDIGKWIREERKKQGLTQTNGKFGIIEQIRLFILKKLKKLLIQFNYGNPRLLCHQKQANSIALGMLVNLLDIKSSSASIFYYNDPYFLRKNWHLYPKRVNLDIKDKPASRNLMELLWPFLFPEFLEKEVRLRLLKQLIPKLSSQNHKPLEHLF